MKSSATSSTRQVTALQLVVVLTVVFLVALSLRLGGLTREPAWLDEVYTFHLSEGSARRVLEVNAADVHPPAYYLGLSQWRSRFGSGLAEVRSYSVAWSLVGIVFILLLAADVGLARAGILLAGLLAAVNPLDIFFAQEARMYSQAAALAAASSWVLWRWLVSREGGDSTLLQGLWLASYACLAALQLHTLYLSVFVLLAQGLFILVLALLRRDVAAILAYAATSLASFILILPWLFFMRAHGPHRLGRLDWLPEPSLAGALEPFYREIFLGRIGPRVPFHLLLMGLSAVVSISVVAIVMKSVTHRAPRWRAMVFLLWVTGMPILLAILVSHLYQRVYFPARFPILVLPTFLVLIAVAAMQFPTPRMCRSLAVTALGIMTIGSSIQYAKITKPGMREFAELYRRLGPPDHLILLPPTQILTASFELGVPLENSNLQQIESTIDRQPNTLIWLGVKRGYLETADPRLRRVYDWLLELGSAEPLATVDGLQVWSITVRRTAPADLEP